MAEDKKKPLRLNITMPAVATDGNGIQVDEKGNVNLIFFQVVSQPEAETTANTVANIRLNVEQLKALGESIDKALEQS